MKRVLLVLAISMALFTNVNAQCSPNFIFTALGIPGVYPPELAIPGVPFVGMDDGMLSNSYSQTLTLVVLEDTTMDVSLLLPTTVIAAMNLAGISTVMALDVNHVTFDVARLFSNNRASISSIFLFVGCTYLVFMSFKIFNNCSNILFIKFYC